MLAFPMTQEDDKLSDLKDMSPSATVGVFEGTPGGALLVVPAAIQRKPINW